MKPLAILAALLLASATAQAQSVCVNGQCYAQPGGVNVAWQQPPTIGQPSIQPVTPPLTPRPIFAGGWPAVSIQGNAGRPMIIRRGGLFRRLFFGDTYIVY